MGFCKKIYNTWDVRVNIDNYFKNKPDGIRRFEAAIMYADSRRKSKKEQVEGEGGE